jgi:hypothetical protein
MDQRVHQVLAEGNLNAEGDRFWSGYWHHIASAKVPLETKVAAYEVLNLRGVANINNVLIATLYDMLLADRAFVAALDFDVYMTHCYRLLTICIDNDVAALAVYSKEMEDGGAFAWSIPTSYHLLKYGLRNALMKINAPCCLRFLFQDKGFRELVMAGRLSPFAQNLAEEFVQPTDQLIRHTLLEYGQSVKIIGMCVEDDELVAAWLAIFMINEPMDRRCPSVMFARKLYALATPDQTATIKTEIQRTIVEGRSSDGAFELAWLCGLLGPSYPQIQECFRRDNMSLFPALIFAMIVAMCDGYLELPRAPKRFFMTYSGMPESERRFFTLVARLPMDLQALVALRLYDHTSIVIQSETFDRAFLAII